MNRLFIFFYLYLLVIIVGVVIKSSQEEPKEPVKKVYSLDNAKCSKDQCLFEDRKNIWK